jgi:23S rRNA (cytidine1920-2'-O)/16S rRNA (cytidine1409-2'-O)-methyltransferase
MPLRADIFLVEHGYAESRSEAQAAIRAGNVKADGKPVSKPAQLIPEEASISYEKAHPYVSRGALKLAGALDQFALSPSGLICLDVGSSTGGFTEVLLERGAYKVYAVDVGHGQMHRRIAGDPRVVQREGVNARDLTHAHVPEDIDAVTIDVSFIGLKLVFPPILKLARPGAWMVALIKPQFEAGQEWIGKRGVVRSHSVHREIVEGVARWLGTQPSWSVLGTMESPIQGGEGNREFLLAAAKKK